MYHNSQQQITDYLSEIRGCFCQFHFMTWMFICVRLAKKDLEKIQSGGPACLTTQHCLQVFSTFLFYLMLTRLSKETQLTAKLKFDYKKMKHF